MLSYTSFSESRSYTEKNVKNERKRENTRIGVTCAHYECMSYFFFRTLSKTKISS